MRRRSKKSQVVNEVKNPSPKKTLRSSARRRKRSSSRSSNENETQKEELVQVQTNQNQTDQNQIDSEMNDSGNTLIDGSENINNNSQSREAETTEIENIERQEESEDKEEENIKGKSTGINNTNNDQTSNNIEPEIEIENENVQGSPPSPKDNDETVQNNNEIQNDENEDVPEDNNLANEAKNVEESESNCNENQQDSFKSEYVQQESADNLNDYTNGQIKNNEEKSTTPEPKITNISKDKLEKKHITLKRLPPENSRRASSPLEDGEIQEPKEKSRKITLKRRTTEENNPEFDKIVINRRSSAGDDSSEKRKRLASVTEENTLTVVGKPNKPPKQVKLVRNFSQETSHDSDAIQRVRKQTWGKSEFLDNLALNIYKIDVDSIKVVCPSVEFLKESEVKLEEVPKEPVIPDGVVVQKMEEDQEEEEGKSEEESEKEQTEEEESSEDQKIEANPNIIALNRKISIVEDTAAKMRPPPSPAKNPSSAILYITNLVRPFTVKQLKELLERTGKIKETGFWTDRIKSKCYAFYESIEEAELTRNALHGVYWPIGNGKQLVIDYATEEDMEAAKNPVPLPVTVTEKIPDKENREPELPDKRHKERERERDLDKEERRRDISSREWDKSQEEHRRRHSKSRSRERVRKHSRRSYTPEDHNRKKLKNTDDLVPQKLMDDLFLKTKAMPSIYWQPLSPQEIATKQQQRMVRMEEHKRRIEENRSRRERDRRGTFRRR